MYLDDGLGTHTNEDICKTVSEQVRQDLIMSGFVPKNEKSKWSPLKNLVFLGYSIDTYQSIVKIPDDRIQKVLKTIEDIEYYTLKYRKVHARLVASLVGQIVSMSYVIGNVAYIMSKHLSIDILRKTSWNSCIVLSKASLIQINFWKENLGRVNVKSFTSDFSCQSVVYSDASNTGYGGYIVETPFNIAHGMWSECESTKSSTWKELNAVKHILLSMVDILKDKRIKWFSDNQNVVSIVAKGSMKPELQDIALCIFENCLTHNISIDAEWAFKNDLLELPASLIEKVSLLPDLLTESKSSNTVQNYYYGFLRWKKWALSNGISSEFILPAKPIHVALYLACLVQQNHTPSPINQAFYSIRWAHKITSEISPTDSDLVKNILEGAKRRLSVPVKKKEPITPDMLSHMFDKFYCEDNLYNQRSICACLLSYSGFLRVSELLNLKTCDVLFFQSHMSVFIQKSKTDIYRDGDRIIIARTGNKLCPVKNLEKYLEWSNNQTDCDLYLFRNLTKSKDSFTFRKDNKPLSYTRMRELFIEVFTPFVPNIKSFGLHSLRAGGASAACNFEFRKTHLERGPIDLALSC
ncbi:unnamed protein product [Mytilus edulis]|uniref:Tyr recombinase domain-containing protein n=1 Tax=Mytilus edulis TaxID=6550 RepID=A0A8S3QRK8_MYTED|nr:unnamed protein product [Mytilus edulis]